MACVLIENVLPNCQGDILRTVERLHTGFVRLASQQISHSLVSSPDEADVILLNASFTLFFSHVDVSRHSLTRHHLLRSHPSKSFVYDPDDEPCPFVRGISPSLDRRYSDRSRQRAGAYVHQLGNQLLDPRGGVETASQLYSFVGAPSTHRVREQVVKLRGGRGLIIATDANWPQDRESRDRFKGQYADAIHDSKFVLCPRGRGTSSTRLFETMQAGRVPEIIADHWVPPDGPDWSTCSVRIRERDVEGIPSLLERMESNAEAMGRAARKAFEEWFSESVVFSRMIDTCLDLKSCDASARPRPTSVLRTYCRPKQLRRYVLKPMADWARNLGFRSTSQAEVRGS